MITHSPVRGQWIPTVKRGESTGHRLQGICLTLVLLVFSQLGLSAVSFAKEYFVANRNPNASDLNPGTIGRPWKTIQKGAETAVAGDTVMVENGIYRGEIRVSNSGQGANRMIVFLAAGDSVVVDGSTPVKGWSLWKQHIWVHSHWPVNSQEVFEDGRPLHQIGGNQWLSPKMLPVVGYNQDDMFPGSFFYDTKSQILYVWLPDGGSPSSHTIVAGTVPVLFWVNHKNYVELRGFKFRYSNTTAAIKLGWPAVAIAGNHCIVAKNYVEWCDFQGIGCNGDYNEIDSNVCNHNGDLGMGVAGRYDRVVGNETSYNDFRRFNVYWQAGGIKCTRLFQSVIEGQNSKGNIGSGIWCDMNCDSVTISRSLSSDNSQIGIIYEISGNGRIFNNLVYSNGDNGIYISASDSCMVVNNTVVDNGRGIVLYGVPRGNNTLNRNRVYDNIVVNESGPVVLLARPSSYATDNVFDDNLYFGGSKSPVFVYGYGNRLEGLTEWRKATGMDLSSLEANPMFVGPATGDFRPKQSSPAAGKGMSFSFIKNDFYGKSRENKKVLGACEP